MFQIGAHLLEMILIFVGELQLEQKILVDLHGLHQRITLFLAVPGLRDAVLLTSPLSKSSVASVKKLEDYVYLDSLLTATSSFGFPRVWTSSCGTFLFDDRGR
jgi:hypothetical protein